MNVSEAIDARRAVKHFDPEFQIPESEFKALIDNAMKSPTSFNIQHWRFVRVVDQDKRNAIRTAAWDQAQITEASDLLIICGDVSAWNKSPERYWRNAPQESKDMMVSMLKDFYDGREWIQRDEVMRSVGIAAQTLMLSAKEKGYDTCPMIGFDQDEVAKIINLPNDHAIGMIVVVGKAAKEAHPRAGSIEYTDALIENNF